MPAPKEVDQADALLVRQWKEVGKVCASKNAAHAALLVSSTLESDDGSELVVTLPKGSSFAMRMLSAPAVSEFVKECVAQVMGPRRIKYVESSLAATAISREKRAAQMPAPAPAPAIPVAPAAPVAPAPEPVAQPAPAAVPAQVPAPAPAPAAPVAPAPEVSYPMPWDEPASGGASVETPDYDQVPYSDDDVAAVLDDSAEDVVSAPVAPTPASAAPVAPASAPTAPVAPAPAPAPAAPEPEPAPAPEPVPAPKPASAPASPEDIAARSALPPELNSVADMLEKVFGPAVSLSVEKKLDAETPVDPSNN